MANIRSLVLKNSSKLNDSEKQIIQFIISNPESCSNLSLSRLARRLYVSESAIFRLCKKLGLSGYSELKFNLDELARERKDSIHIVNDFSENLSKSLQDVFKYFKGLDLKNLFQELDETEHVYVYSTGWQQELIAEYLAHELFIIGKTAIVLPAALDELKAANSFSQTRDILFIISYTGDNVALNAELSQLKLTNDKFKYISFTNLKQNKLASLSQYNFYYPTVTYSQDSYYVDGKVAFTPVYYLIDLLIGEYATHCRSTK